MLSFKGIAGFLKKVGGGREEHAKETQPRSSADGAPPPGSGMGVTTFLSSASDGDSTDRLPHRRASLGISHVHPRMAAGGVGSMAGSAHCYGGDPSSISWVDSPSSGVPPKFGDHAMQSSYLLKGLPPNASTQDVLLHIQRVVQERNAELQRDDEKTQACVTGGSQGVISKRGSLAAEGIVSGQPSAPGVVVQRPKNGSLGSLGAVETTDPSMATFGQSISQLSTVAKGGNKGVSPAAASCLLSPTSEVRGNNRRLQKIREEMIDALDVCLQEVPEDHTRGVPGKARQNDEDRARQGKQGEGDVLQPAPIPPPVPSRSASVSSPSALAMVESVPAERGASSTAIKAEENAETPEEGPRGAAGHVAPRRSKPTLSALSDMTDITPTQTLKSPSAKVFGLYEWRQLLMDIIGVLGQIDRALLRDVRRRARQRLASAAAMTEGPSSDGAAEFRSVHLSQVLPAAAVSGSALLGSVDMAAASASGVSRIYPHRTSTHGAPRQTGEPITGGDPSGHGTSSPSESAMAQMLNSTATIKAAHATSPLSKKKLPTETPSGVGASKEDKKLLEELITAACSLASWAIAKSILRHHLTTLEKQTHRCSSPQAVLTPTSAFAVCDTSVRHSVDGGTVAVTSVENAVMSSIHSGRPPLAPPPPPPPAAVNDAASAADTSEPPLLSTEASNPKASHSTGAAEDADAATPYIDWPAVVRELSEWIGERHSLLMAECILCATFLRDDGREVVLCMLQTPKPRHLLNSIHRHADRVGRAEPELLMSGPASPRASISTVAAAGNLVNAASAPVSNAPATITTSSAGAATASGTTTSSSAAGGSAAVATNAGLPTTTLTKTTSSNIAATSALHSTTPVVPEYATLVMDDLVAELEMTYRKAVANTWAKYLEDAIEADLRPLVPSTAMNVALASSGSTGCHGVPEHGASFATGVANRVHSSSNEQHLKSPILNGGVDVPSTATVPFEGVTDTRTLCSLATAFFFGSDAWLASKKDRYFALLFRSMRGRLEKYSESAATRRLLRRGAASGFFPAQSTPCAAESHALLELAETGALVTAPNSRAVSPSQSLTNPPLPNSSASKAVAVAVLSEAPLKASAEGTPARHSTPAGVSSQGSHVPAAGTPVAALGATPSPHLVLHQLLSSNVSTAAVSPHSTPLAASLHVGRESATADLEEAPGMGGGFHNGSGFFTVASADPPITWTPCVFSMNPSETATPPPELNSSSPHSVTQRAPEEGQQDGNEHHASLKNGEVNAFLPQDAAMIPPVVSSTVAGATPSPPPGSPLDFLECLVLERIVNMSWSAALHKRGEQCLRAKPPRLEEAQRNAVEERLVAGAYSEFRARQRAIVSLVNARLASGKSVEALMNSRKHFNFEKKEWTSHNQTIFSAMLYLQSMVLLVRAQAACRMYGAVIETVQFVLPQAALCEQMLQVLAPQPRGDYILRFADCRSKLLRSYVYLRKECWLAYAAFNDLVKAERYFIQCAQVLQLLRRRVRETEQFVVYMERGSQLMKLKDYQQAVKLFGLAVAIAKQSLNAIDAAAATTNSSTATQSAVGCTVTSMANAVTAAAASFANNATLTATPQQFHRNLHLRAAGSGSLSTAEEHTPGVSDANEDDLELVWRVAESERMLALSYVTQAEHEVNVRERREELSNAVKYAYSSQRSLQRWQKKGGTPKRLLTAVPCSLIVICRGLLLLNQPRKAALLLEPLIENKPNSAMVRPPMWREILHPTEDPYTAEDVVLRTYVSSVKIAVFMLYAKCLAEFDGDRALRAVTLVEQLLQESDAWIYTILTHLRRALEELRTKDKANSEPFFSPRATQGVESGDEGRRIERQAHEGMTETSISTSAAADKEVFRTIDVPPLQGVRRRASLSSPLTQEDSQHRTEFPSADETPLHVRDATPAGAALPAALSSTRQVLLQGELQVVAGEDGAENDSRRGRSSSMQSGIPGANGSRTEASSVMNASSAAAAAASVIPGALNNPRSLLDSTATPLPLLPPVRVQIESLSEFRTALFALRESKSHIRKALRDILIVSGDAYALIKNWEEALKVYSHTLNISMSEVEAAKAASRSRRRGSKGTPRACFASPFSSMEAIVADDLASPPVPYMDEGARPAVGSSNDVGMRGANGEMNDWGQVFPLDDEFFLWDEENVFITENLVNRELSASTVAKDLRAVVADEERMNSRACETVVLSKLANVYRALEKPSMAVHYHTLVLDYANECHDKLLAYNSMLSLARLYTAANLSDKARDAWAKVSELAKDYEDKEVSRETMRNIIAGQEAAGMYLDVVKMAEELEKLATGEEGEDAARDRRFALEALAHANLQLGQYDACIAALDSREKVQEKSAEWNGALLSMRAKARMGLSKSAEAIKVMQMWATKARNLGNWVELGKAHSALSAAHASENHHLLARHHHQATLNAFALVEAMDDECRHIALDSARWLVHYAYLDDGLIQLDPSLIYTGGSHSSDSNASVGDCRYADSGVCNNSGDLGIMLEMEAQLRRSSSIHGSDGVFNSKDEDGIDLNGQQLNNHSMFSRAPEELMLANPPPFSEDSKLDTEDMLKRDEAVIAKEEDGGEGVAETGDYAHFLSSFTSASFGSKDPGAATQPPSLASSFNVSQQRLPEQGDGEVGEASDASSSTGQSDGGDNEGGDEADEETRRRLEVADITRSVMTDEDAKHFAHPALLSINVEGEEAADLEYLKKPPPKQTSPVPTPTITTAAVKPTTNTPAVMGSATPAAKSVSSTYVPPPTGLANVSICSRPAAAAAGTDVLEFPIDSNHPASEHASDSRRSSTSSPLMGNSPRGATFPHRSTDALDAVGGGGGDDDDAAQERKPATVRTTYFRGAIEIMETTAQLLLIPRCVRHIYIPLSPAEAVDLALLAHPQSLFVFYFAEYTTAYGAQCDVVVRPPGVAFFMKLRTQISLKEYHSKDVLTAVLATASSETQLSAHHPTTTATDPASMSSPSAHPFGAVLAKVASGGATTAGTGAAPTPHNVSPQALRAALDEETSTCLRNLYADVWQPVVDRMRRENVPYQTAETLIIMPDISLLHLPFAGMMPSPHSGDEDAPLGEQFTLTVTPSLVHFVQHGMIQQHPEVCHVSGATDPDTCKYIFFPYDSVASEAHNSASTAAIASLAMPIFTSSAPLSPNAREQAPSKGATASVFSASTSVLQAAGSSASSRGLAPGSTAPPPPTAPFAAEVAPSGHTTSVSSTAETPSRRHLTAAGEAGLKGCSATSEQQQQQHPPPLEGYGIETELDLMLHTWRVHRGCTRKELIHAFTDARTRTLVFLAPVEQGMIRVADGVVTITDLMQALQQTRAPPLPQPVVASPLPHNSSNASNINYLTAGNGAASTFSAASVPSPGLPGAPAAAGAPPCLASTVTAAVVPPPPLCSHIDLVVIAASRAQYPSASDAGAATNLCMILAVDRVLRVNMINGLSPNEEHLRFVALYLSNLKKVMRWSLHRPYAVALRTTIAEARKSGMSSNTWGAFTLVGVP